jgi:hypothetical protein
MMRSILCAAVLAAALPLRAAEEAELCYNYGCTAKAAVRFSTADLKRVQSLFADVADAEAERAAIARAIGEMYTTAGTQTPVWRDRGGNIEDEDVDGRMDCIDHSTNTTTWLHVIARQGWLKHHQVGERIQRGRFIFVHWGARIVESGSSAEYVVDTWFLDPGHPAIIFSIDRWKDGAYPPGTEPFRWN